MATITNKIRTRIQQKIDTAAHWEQYDPILLKGELACVVCDDGISRMKIGDGTSTYSELPFTAKEFKLKVSGDGGKTFTSYDELQIVHIDEAEYVKLIKDGLVLSNALYEVSSDNFNANFEQVKNVADPTDDYDAVNKRYVDSQMFSKSVVKLTIPESGTSQDLSVLNIVKVTKPRYQQMEQSGAILSDHLYIVEAEDDDDGIIFGGNSFTC